MASMRSVPLPLDENTLEKKTYFGLVTTIAACSFPCTLQRKMFVIKTVRSSKVVPCLTEIVMKIAIPNDQELGAGGLTMSSLIDRMIRCFRKRLINLDPVWIEVSVVQINSSQF